MNSLCWVLSVRCFIRLLMLLEDAAVLPLDNFTENSLQSVLLWVSSLLIKNICPDRCHFLSPVTRYARISGLWVRVNERRRTNTSTGPTPRLQSAVRRGQRCNWTDITSHPPWEIPAHVTPLQSSRGNSDYLYDDAALRTGPRFRPPSSVIQRTAIPLQSFTSVEPSPRAWIL